MSGTDERSPLTQEAILARSIEIVDATGIDSLSLRSLARDLGVSAPALYDHIESKDSLLRLLAGEGYANLTARWAELDSEDIPAWIRATSHSYVGFALDRPGLFAAMFRYRPIFVSGPGALEDTAATAVFQQSLAVIERAVATKILGGASPVELALGLWAAMHGAATVLSMSPEMRQADWLVDLMIDGLLAGWKQAGAAEEVSDF